MSRAEDFAYFDHDGPIAMAHRGGAAYRPNVGRENTLAAFRVAHSLGYRYFETDVHSTADGELVAFHDAHLDRVTDATGAIHDLPYAVVRQARVAGTDEIPLLDALLEEFPDARFNIDIKADTALAPTVEVIRAHQAIDRVCLGAFSSRRIQRVRRALGPRLATAAGPRGTGALRFLPTVISRVLHTPSPVLQVPATHRIKGRRITLVTTEFIKTAHDLGKQVHVWFHAWAPETEAELNRLLDLGVDGLVCDRIDLLREVLTARGHPLG